MQLKTILNRIEHFKSFVYSHVQMIETDGQLTIEIALQPRANGRPLCSGCGQPRPGYDRLPQRRFEYVPLWGITVYFQGCALRYANTWAFGPSDKSRPSPGERLGSAHQILGRNLIRDPNR